MTPSVDDPRGDLEALDGERKRIRKTAEVRERDGYADQPPTDDDDREALLAWADVREGEVAPSTAAGQVLRVRTAIEIAAEPSVDVPPIVEWSKPDFDRFNNRLKNGEVPAWYTRKARGETWGEGTLGKFKSHLKAFLTWLGDANPDDYGEWAEGPRYWADGIEPGGHPDPKVQSDDLLTPDELADLWAQAQAEGPRDALFVALPLATWQRNAVLRSFRVGDVKIPEGESEGFVRVNEEAVGRKGMAGKKPLRWASGPARKWVEHRRRSPEYDADDGDPLLCQTTNSGLAEKGGSLGTNKAINRRLRELGERAGLARDRWDTSHGRHERTLRAHLLRYTGATRAALSEDISTEVVKQQGWGNQNTKMLDRYINITDNDVLAAWSRASGINSDHFSKNIPEFGHCESCGFHLCDWHVSCPNCGLEVGAEAPGSEEIQVEDESRIREIVEKTVMDMLEIGDDADMDERAEAGSARLAVLAGDDDFPDPAPLRDLMAREGLSMDDIGEVEIPETETVEEGEGSLGPIDESNG